MSEIWKKIDWIDGLKSEYEISSLGNIRCIGYWHHTFQGEKYIKCERYLHPHLNTNGYYYVNLYVNKKLVHFYIHRLVADAFLEKEEGKGCINHKNEIRTDNRISNLERCTQSYNVRHSAYKQQFPTKGEKSNQYGRNIRKNKKDGKYEVCCYHAGKGINLGRYFTVEEARKARNAFFETMGFYDFLTEDEKECKA